jgi:opacity protein-like surface antigen
LQFQEQAKVKQTPMTRLVLVALTLPLLSLSLLAQSNGKFEIFGGYSYFDGSYTAEGVFPNNPSGWNVAVTDKLNRWVGITADFSGYSQSDGIGDSAKTFNFLFGPTASLTFHRLTPFAHFLLGDSHVSPSGFRFLDSNNSFAYVAGGGLDYEVIKHAAVRVQIDELHNGFTTFDNQLQYRVDHNLPRISTGIVVRF